MRIQLAKDTPVSFEGDAYIYHIEYQDLLYCEQPCPIPHESDCFEEPYVSVYKIERTSMPVSKLKHVFDTNGYGRKFDLAGEVA